MSAESQLDQAFGILLAKARQREQQQRSFETAQAAALVINFDGAGQALTVGMGGIPEMPPGAFTITGCHMVAGIWDANALEITPIPVTASVNLRLASQGTWQGGSRALYGNTMPALTAQAEAEISLAGWITELQPGDLIPYALATFTGTATVLTLTLTLRRLDVTGIDAPAVFDGSGDAFTDSDGSAFVIRS